MILHPGMVQAGVVGDKVKQQPQPALAQAFAEPHQSGIPSQLSMDRVARDGETGTGDVFLTEVR